jgi:hypothetical protein
VPAPASADCPSAALARTAVTTAKAKNKKILEIFFFITRTNDPWVVIEAENPGILSGQMEKKRAILL